MFDRITDKMSDWKEDCKDKLYNLRHRNEVFDDSTDSSSDDPKNPKPMVTTGMDLTVKTFFEGKDSQPNFYNWVETPPKQASKRTVIAHNRVAIKVYKVKDHEKPVINGRFALKYHMVDVQNPVLVECLKEIVKKENVHLEASEIATFKYPFRPLWFSWPDIDAAYQRASEGSTIKDHILTQQLALLLKVMAEIFGSMKKHLRSMESSGLISYKYAWTYFPKDSIVYSPDKDCERLYKVVDTEIKTRSQSSSSYLCINCQEIRFDGESFVWEDAELEIDPFTGNKPVTDLDHYPLKFHEDPEDVKVRLAERGKRVLDYQGLKYCEYGGLGIYVEGTKIERHNVSGRILIDSYGYNKHHLGLKRREGKDQETQKNRITHNNRGLPPPPPPIPTSTVIVNDDGSITTLTIPSVLPGATSSTTNNSPESYIKRLSDDEQRKNKEEMLKRKDDLIFISPILLGFALKNKLWLHLYVDDIKPVIWNDEAYDHLVYPEEQKDLVLSFVENHAKTKMGMDDVIMGKGQGLIFLLSGPPGTGKTLTAEAVADKTRKPLYYLQAEDLGINASLLGANLKKCFEMAIDWDAVILLDEADVFMAERHPNDIARNELVSIFLRELEYFRGIIFLTTNLYDTIDTAFRSRVNIHLLFRPLPPDARVVLWRKFLDRLPPVAVVDEHGRHVHDDTNNQMFRPMAHGLNDEDLKELGLYALNGREIKNAIKTVKSWCECKSYEMTLSRLESAIKVTAPQAVKQGGNSDLYD